MQVNLINFCRAVAGDDEQSDFYCEPDYPYAGGVMAASMIGGARSRWKTDHCRQFPFDSHLAELHQDIYSQLSPSLRNSYKTRCKILARTICFGFCFLTVENNNNNKNYYCCC